MKRILALLLCVLMISQLAACNLRTGESVLQQFENWLKGGGYQTTTTTGPDGITTTTLIPPGTTVPSSTVPVSSPRPTTGVSSLPTTVPVSTPGTSTVPTGTSTTGASTAVTTSPTTAPTTTAPTTAKPTTAKPTTAKPTTATPTTAKPTTAKPTTATPTTAKPTTKPIYGNHTTLDYTQRYLYNLLSAEEKGWYRAIDAAVNRLSDTAELGVDLTVNQRHNIYFVYMFDNPEHFYLGGKASYSSGGTLYMSYSDGTTNSYRGNSVSSLTQTMRDNIRARKAGFDAEVDRITGTIPVNIPAVEKEKMIYDRLLIDMCYNTDAIQNGLWDGVAQVNWTAYGGIINKTGVCEAYSEAFQTLCYAVGINCTGIVGTVDGGGHKWNAVQLDGDWYACDVTFDDPLGSKPNQANYHRYFNATTAQMAKDGHSTNGSSYPGPACTATKYSYSNYFG